MSNFDSTKTRLADLLRDIVGGKIQLPDFQRGWVWDDEHTRVFDPLKEDWGLDKVPSVTAEMAPRDMVDVQSFIWFSTQEA